jgi:hypothetical protein
MNAAVTAAVAALLRKPNLTDGDRAHLERWASDEYAAAPTWRRLVNTGRERGIFPANSLYEDLVEESLYMRRRSESVACGIDFDLRENQRQHQRLLDLAKNAEEIADYYKWAEDYSGIAMFYYRFFRPVAELEEIHRREAELFRQRARRRPRPSVRVSRQDRSKGRKGLRKINAFIDLANEYLTFGFSEKPDYEAIALLTEIAFPDFEVDPEYVRKALRPTTVAGREAARALATEKS